MTIDGLRVNFADGWGLVRPSNTTPCLVLRFEAESEKVMVKIQELFREFILAVSRIWCCPSNDWGPVPVKFFFVLVVAREKRNFTVPPPIFV